MKNISFLIIINIMILSQYVKCDENRYDIYSKGINYVLQDYKNTYDTTFSEYFFISEVDLMGKHVLLPFQEQHFDKIINFSEELAMNVKNNDKMPQLIKDSLILDFPYEILPEKIYSQYFRNKNKSNSWDLFYEAYRTGAIISFSEVIYNETKDNAAYLLFLLNGNFGGRAYLVLAEKKNMIWNVHNIELLGISLKIETNN